MRNFRRASVYLFDGRDGVENHLIARWIFLRGLGGIYFSAFFAFLFQVLGLIGTTGILPATQYLARVHQLGSLRFWYAPTLLWFSAGNQALMIVCWAGLAASLLLIANIAPRIASVICFVSFLSIIAVAQDFGQYQSDGMLLEGGFLSIFIVPAGMRPRWGSNSRATRAAWFLLLWEWFRIYFQSGAVKLLSGDPTWRNFTAMYEYYQNGPLPTWVGWYLQHLPNWFHIATAVLTLVMELLLVWMAFLPGRWRIACFCIVTLWQIGVIATANYAFLNYLVLILAVLLLNDTFLRRITPIRWRQLLPESAKEQILERDELPRIDEARSQTAEERTKSKVAPLKVTLTAVILSWIGYATAAELIYMFRAGAPLPSEPVTALEPFRIANEYGLFANMTPNRYEIEFQGSDDGKLWKAYPFRYKPQDIHDRPRIYAPYQPRFDWNLWFASLGSWQEYPIVPLTEERLLQNDPHVLDLFYANPFVSRPPRMVRAVIWQYWFSTSAQKQSQGAWWRRQLIGSYAPTILRSDTGEFSIVDRDAEQ